MTEQEDRDTTFYVDVPDLFRPLPLAATEAELDGQLEALADELMTDAGEAWRRMWTGFSKTLMGTLLQADTRYAGLCCERDTDAGWVSPAALVVALPQLSFDDPRVAAAGMAQVLGAGPSADARVQNLPCGPAAVVVNERRLRLPDPAEAGFRLAGDAAAAGQDPPTDGGERVLPVREAQIYIPYQPWQRMVLIVLSTPAISDWEAYARIFVRIARSVRFGPLAD